MVLVPTWPPNFLHDYLRTWCRHVPGPLLVRFDSLDSAVDLFGSAVDLFGSAIGLFGSAVDLFGSAFDLFGSAVDLFGSAIELSPPSPDRHSTARHVPDAEQSPNGGRLLPADLPHLENAPAEVIPIPDGTLSFGFSRNEMKINDTSRRSFGSRNWNDCWCIFQVWKISWTFVGHGDGDERM